MRTADLTRNAAEVVYVLDDERQVLDVIEMQLRGAGYADVRTYSRPTDFLGVLDKLPPGVVISDHRMPEVNGLQVQQQLQQRDRGFQLILLSGFPETRVAVEAMKRGAVTVLDKPYQREQLLSSLRDAFAALRRSKSDAHTLPKPLSDGQLYLQRLSARERQVIDLVYEGETNKSIAELLEISIKTVEKHRGRAMKKMVVTSIAELIRLIDRELPLK